jgi:hypothetical protein
LRGLEISTFLCCADENDYSLMEIIAAKTILENNDFLHRIISSEQRVSIESRLKLNFSFQS